MKIFICCCFCLLGFGVSRAQEAFGKMVVGIEGAMDADPIGAGDGFRPYPTLQVEYPVGKFSVGTGISYQRYANKVQSSRYLGQSQGIVSEGRKALGYLFEYTTVRPVYFSVPFRVQYRLPCNCVYLHASAALGFLQERASSTHVSNVEVRPEGESATGKTTGGPRDVLQRYEIGVGFKLHASDYFRLVMRPGLAWTQNADLGSGDGQFTRTLLITFGAQYAFVRYGSKRG